MIYTIDELKKRIVPVVKKYGLPAVYIFGSYAKGEATEDSDVDILIDKSGSTLVGLFAMGGLYNDLRNAVGKEIDLVTTGILEQESTKKRTPRFVENINKEKIKIYGENESVAFD